jgi:hypothetical protein
MEAQRSHGVVAGTLGKVFGSTNQQRYLDLRSEIVDLLARARTGAAITANEERTYASQLPGRFAEPFGIGVDPIERLKNFESKINASLGSKLDVNGVAIYGYSDVKIGDQTYKVGQVVTNADGRQGRVNPDGSITLIK